MTTTTNYSLNIVEGSDIVNPLVVDNPNYETIDSAMYANKLRSVCSANEVLIGTTHAIDRSASVEDINMFHFTATSNYSAGDTFTVDGTSVTALTPAGSTLPQGAYIIGSEVLCYLRDTLLTVFVGGGTGGGGTGGTDADTLEGHPASYFATAGEVETIRSSVALNEDEINDHIKKVGFYNVSLPSANWNDATGDTKQQTVSNLNVTASFVPSQPTAVLAPNADADTIKAVQKAMGRISMITSGTGTLTFVCAGDAPETDLVLRVSGLIQQEV